MTQKTPLLLAGVASLATLGCERAPTQARVEVFAASSLREVFADLEREFERAYPGVDVRVTFAGSQVLRLQIEQGARADLFASAHPDHTHALHQANLLTPGQTFAHNDLVVITPRADTRLTNLTDLPRAERVILGTPSVPVGMYADQILGRAGLTPRVVSRETNTRLVRAKVELGEADAALVYRTDASDRVRVVELSPDQNVQARYQIATTPDASPHANAFLAYVLGRAGQQALTEHGFRPGATP